MATVTEVTFDGGTDGAAIPIAAPFTAGFGSMSYTSDAHDGGMAANAGPNTQWLAIPVSSYTHWRLRMYLKRTGTQTAHHWLVTVQDSANANLADLQIRFTGGGVLWNRVNFATVAGSTTTTVFPTNEWRRVDYEWTNNGNVNVIVYTAADDTVVDYTLTIPNTAVAARVLIGNVNSASGLAVRFDSIALTDGSDPGPYSAAVAPRPTVRGALVAGANHLASVRGVIVSGAEQAASVREVIGSMTPDPTYLPGWTLTFNDEFNGTSIDTTKWNVRNNDSNSNEQSYLLAANVGVANGNLQITAKKENVGGKLYTSGYIDSIGKFSQRYGLWRMRAKLNTPIGSSQGIWPALWLRGDTSVMEIDIIEAWGVGASGPLNGYRTGSGAGTLWESTNGGAKLSAWATAAGVDLSADFHIYECEWTADYIALRCDGVEFVRATPTNFPYMTGPNYAGAANMRINVQVSSDGAYYGAPDASTVFPNTLLVDWVRVYTPAT